MGSDKALASLTEGGPPLLQLVLDAVRVVADDILVIGDDRQIQTSFPFRTVPDVIPGAAALGGIHAAVVTAKYEHCLVVACDMPFLNGDLLEYMATRSRNYDVLIPVLSGESRQRPDGLIYQTLHAIYSRSVVPAIEREIAAHRLKVIGFFSDVRVRTIGPETIGRLDPNLRSFFNANTPETLALARRIAADSGP